MTSGLLSVPFHPDEVLLSFLARTSRANGSPNLNAFFSHLGIDGRGVFHGDLQAVRKLADILGRSAEELLSRHPQPRADGRVSYCGYAFDRASVLRRNFRYCQACLEDDLARSDHLPGTRTYVRASWLLPVISACRMHAKVLREAPCAKPGRWTVPDFALASEECARFSGPDTRVLDEVTAFVSFVCDGLAGRPGHGDILDTLSLSSGITLCMLVGLSSTYGRDYALDIDMQTRRMACATGFAILKSGEGALRLHFEALGLNHEVTRRSGRYGRISRDLVFQDKNGDLAHVRSLMDETKASCGKPSTTERAPGCRASLIELARHSGHPPWVAKKILVAIGMPAYQTRQIADSVPINIATKLLDVLNDAATLTDIAIQTSWPLSDCRLLSEAGLIQTETLRQISSDDHRLFSRRLALSIAELPLSAMSADELDDMSLRDAIAPLPHDRACLVLRSALNDGTLPVRRVRPGAILDGTLVNRAHLSSLLSTER